MSDVSAELAALDDEEARATARALAAADDARAVLRLDLPAFVEREAKRAFMAAPAFAEGLSDDAIAAIKGDVARSAAEARDRILAALAVEDPWLAGAGQAGGEELSTSFEDNAALWQVIAGIDAAANDVLRRHFPEPEGGHQARYRQPAFFVGGRHMKSVAEHYWRALRDVHDVRARRDQIEGARRAEGLRARWDSIG